MTTQTKTTMPDRSPAKSGTKVGWREVKLGDVSEILSGGTPSSSKPEYWVGGDIPWATLPDLRSKYLFDTQRKITKLGLKNSSAKLLPVNSVIFSSRATIGEISIAKIETTTNQGSKNFICNPDKLWYEFLYYLLKNKVEMINGLATGATYKEINKTVFSSIEISLPDISTQKQIADVLSAYDDLIENNTKRIKILEQIAQTIYREWFVYFRFPGHEKVKKVDSKTEFGKIPEGWEIGKVEAVADLLSGFTFKSGSFVDGGEYKVVTIKSVHDGEFKPEGSDTIDDIPKNMPEHCNLTDGDILLSLTGNVGRVCLVYGKKLLLNQRVAKVNPKKSGRAFVYELFRNSDFRAVLQNLAVGAAQQNLSPIQTLKLPIIIPSPEILSSYEMIVEHMLEEIIKLNKQNYTLRRARDLLLPKLVIGEIRI